MTEIDGRPAALDEIKALALTNYGHFTSMLVEDLRVRGLNLHLDRLERDAQAVFGATIDRDKVRHLVRHQLQDARQPVVARVTVFDPDLELGHPGAPAEPSFLVTRRPAPSTPPAPMRLQSVVHAREQAAVKHVGLFPTLHHRRVAQHNGYDDALFVDTDANISEAATTNIGFIRGDEIHWPDADVLPGVTMALLNQAHTGLIHHAAVNLADLSGVDAVFATNAAIGVRAVEAIDQHHWNAEHPIITTLRHAYEQIPPEPL